jgi:hypothetical protein
MIMVRGNRLVLIAAVGTVTAFVLALWGVAAPFGPGESDVPDETLVRSPAPLVPWAMTRESGGGRLMAVRDGTVIQLLDGLAGQVLEARDQRTGESRWRAGVLSGDAFVADQTLVIHRPGPIEWFGPDERLAGYDLKDGNLLWEREVTRPGAVGETGGGTDPEGGIFAMLTLPAPAAGITGSLQFFDARTGNLVRAAVLPAECTNSFDTHPIVASAGWVVVRADCAGHQAVLGYPVDRALPQRVIAVPGRYQQILGQGGERVLAWGDAGAVTMIDLKGGIARPVPQPGTGPGAATAGWRALALCGDHFLLQDGDHRFVDLDAATLDENWRTSPMDWITGVTCAKDRVVILTTTWKSESGYQVTSYSLSDGRPSMAGIVPGTQGHNPDLLAGESFAAVRLALDDNPYQGSIVYGVQLT